MVIDSVLEVVVLVVLVSELAGLDDDGSVVREELDLEDNTEDDCCDGCDDDCDDDEDVTTSMNRVRVSSHVAVGIGLEGSTENRPTPLSQQLIVPSQQYDISSLVTLEHDIKSVPPVDAPFRPPHRAKVS